MEKLMPKNKIFSISLMLEGIKQTKAIGIFALIITLLGSCARPVLSIVQYGISSYNSFSSIDLSEFAVFIFFAWVIFPIILVISLFSFMNKRNASDFYHAIPLNRTCVYTSYSAAVAFWGIVSIVSCSFISYILYQIAVIDFFMPFDFIGKTILASLIAMLLSMSVTLLAKGLSGTEFANIIITFLIMFAPRISLMFFVETTLRTAYIIPAYTVELANPTWNILLIPFSNSDYGYFTEVITRPSTLIYSSVLAVVYYILGLIVHKFRKSETAGTSASYRGVQIAVRSIIGFMPLIPLCVGIVTKKPVITAGYFLILVTASVLLYFLYELVTTKSGKKLLTAIPMYLIVIGLSCVFTFGSLLLRNSMLNDIPSVSEIESVSLTCILGYSRYNDKEIIDYKFKDADMIKVLQSSLVDNVNYIESQKDIYDIYDEDYRCYSVVFHTTSGRDIQRDIYVRNSEDISVYILNDKNYLKWVTELPPENDIQFVDFVNYDTGYTKDANSCSEAWDMYKQEYSALTNEQKFELFRNNIDRNLISGYFYCGTYINDEYSYSSLPLVKGWFPETYKILFEEE